MDAFKAAGKELVPGTPFVGMTSSVLQPESALVFELSLPPERCPIPIQVNVDAWPKKFLWEKIFIRIRSQGLGCTFKCKSCFASTLKKALTLKVEEIVHQVVQVLDSVSLGKSNLKDMTVAFMGLGEPFANNNIVASIKELHERFPLANFIVSTTGPRTGKKILEGLINLTRKQLAIDLQLSIHSLRQDWRLDFIGDRLYNGKPLASWTLLELAQVATEWFASTGRKIHANFGIGPDFHVWETEDFARCAELFPAQTTLVKLSLEGPYDGNHWDMRPHQAILLQRQQAFEAMGYQTYLYAPEGLDEGGSCGAQKGNPAHDSLIKIL